MIVGLNGVFPPERGKDTGHGKRTKSKSYLKFKSILKQEMKDYSGLFRHRNSSGIKPLIW